MKKLFKCTVCGYVHEGTEAPDFCPKCGAPKEKFAELSKEDADKIYASDRTNDIHMEIIELMGKVGALCQEGLDIKLDSTCVLIFELAKNEAWVIKQRAKAELAGHMVRGKW